MTAAEFAPLREWQPALNEQVLRWDQPGVVGTVVRCDRYGHFGDPYWRVSVEWPSGRVEDGIETSSLIRPDGSQGAR